MKENSSYFVTVFAGKDERQAEYTQEVFFVPGDPPEVQIRFVEYAWCLKIKRFSLLV